ncbi:DUF4232 domain-containing protein [Streptomyces sp. NPDC005336]|uniref:DUF4232 domain-containing protein n=1 Tax=Streptomyces sp. NPDC005336 TaxID=3157035 RepID=UPI0033A015A1
MSLTTAFLAHRARTLRSVAAGLTIVAAGVTLTACGSNGASGVKTSGKAESSATTPAAQGSGAKGGAQQDTAAGGGADAGAQGGAQAGGSSGDGSGGTTDSGASGTSAGGAGAKKTGAQKTGAHKTGGTSGGSEVEIGTCDLNKMVVSVESVTRPVNHLLLKVTNGAGVNCNVPGFPLLRFDDAQAPTAAAEETKPQAVVSLAPGESAYAGITTSGADGSGSDGTKVSKVTVFLSDADGSSTVDLPGGSVYIDSKAEVSYWQSDASDALSW